MIPSFWLPCRPDQPGLVREHHRLYAVAQVELGEDPPDVGLHGGLGDHEPVGDLGVGQVSGDRRG